MSKSSKDSKGGKQPNRSMWFGGSSLRRIGRFVLAVYCWTQISIGVLSPVYAQKIPIGPIADPRAPIAFQPSINNLPNGASVVNITAPNAAGLSLNQYQQFDVAPAGVVLNNSQIGGTPLLGGTVSANPHLTGNTANTIVNEVTVQGAPSQIGGTIEVFGNPAAVIIANPNGISCDGCGVVNTPRLSFSTGRITLQDIHGAGSSFDLASSVGYNIQGGQVAIQGTGIEGTVGQIDLIGELLRIDGPLRAHYLNQGISSINLTAGKTPGAPVLAARSDLPGSASAGNTAASAIAIDASALGAMTAGRITVISTDAGMGVNLRGPVLAYQQDIDIQSAGRVSTGDLAASRDIRINADGFVVTGGSVAANDKLQVSGKEGILLAGPASAGQGIELASSQGNVSAQGPLATAGDLQVTAAQRVTLESQSAASTIAGNTSLKGETVTIAGQFAGGKDLSINAHSGAAIAGNATVGGNLSMRTGGDAALFGNIQVNQSADVMAGSVTTGGTLTVGQNMDIAGTNSVDLLGSTTVGNQLNIGGGQVTLAGDLDARQTQVDASQLHLGGTDGNFSARGDLDLSVSQDFHTSGNVSVTGSLGLHAGGDAQFGGTVTTGSNFGVNAGGSIGLGGAVNSGGSVNLVAGNNINTADSITAGGNVSATAGGSMALGGAVSSGGNVNLVAGNDISTADSITAGGNVSGTAGGSMALGGAVSSGGNVNLVAGNDISTSDSITAAGSVSGTAGGSIALGDQVNSAGAQNWQAQGDISAAQGLHGSHVTVGGNNVQIAGPVLGNGNVNIAANNQLQLGNEIRADGNLALSSQQGDVVAQSVFANDSVGISSHGNIDVQTVQAANDLALSASTGQITAQSLLAGRDLGLSAQDRIQLQGDAGAGRNASIQSAQAGVQAGNLSAGNDLTVLAAQAIQVAGGASAGGDMALSSQNAGVSAQTLLANGDLSTQAAGDIIIAGTVAAGGNNQLHSSAGQVDLGADLYGANSVSVIGNSVQLAQGLQSGGLASVTANTGAIHSAADMVAAGNMQLQSAGATTVSGSLQSGANLALQSGADTSISGNLAAQQNISVQSAGDLQATHIASTGDTSLAANRIQANDVQAGGQAELLAQQDIELAQDLMAGSISTHSAAGDTRIGGTVGTAGALAMQAGGNLSAADVVAGVGSAQASSIQAVGSVQLGSLQTGGDYTGRAGQNHLVAGQMLLQGHADVQAGGNIEAGSLAVGQGLLAQAGNDIVVNGDATIMGTAQLQSGGAQRIAGHLQVTDQLQSTAHTGLQVGGDLVANNGLQITSAAGSLAVGGLLGTQGAATVNAAQGVQVAGDVLANSVNLASSHGGIALGGNLSTQSDAALQAQQDVAIAGATTVMGNLQAQSNAGSITFGNDLQVAGRFAGHAHQDLNFLGDSLLLGQATLQADTGRIYNLGQMNLGQALQVNTTGDLVNEGTIQSQGDIAVNARNISSNLVNAGGIVTAGNLALQASGAAQLGQQGTLSAGQDLSLQAANGTQTAGTIQAGQDLHYAGGELLNTGTVAAQNADIQASLGNQGGVYIQSDLSVSGSTSNSGEIAADAIQMAGLDNSGQVGAQSASLGATSNSGDISAGSVAISGGLSNSGAVSGGSSVSVYGGSTSNDGSIAGGTVSLAGSSISNGGQIQSSGAMSISGGSFDNRLQESKTCPSGNCSTPESYQYSQNPGTVFAGGPLSISVNTASNQGVINAGSDISISGALSNERSANDPYTSAGANGGAVSGIISAGGNLTVTGPTVTNTGQLQAGGAVQITSTGSFSNAKAGTDVAGQVVGNSLNVTAGSITNEGMLLAQAGNADLQATSGTIANNGTIAASEDLNLTAAGAISNSEGANLLGNNISITGDAFSNAGVVYGQNAPPSKISIQSTNGVSNAVTGTIIAGEKLDIKGSSYSNAGGVVGSLGDASLAMAGTYSPAGNSFEALGKLDLQVGGISVGVDESWSTAASEVSWSGTLHNYGSVSIAGNASGSVVNEASGTRYISGSPSKTDGTYIVYPGSYPSYLQNVETLGYTDVEHRAQLYIGGGLDGSLTNIASDASVGGTSYTPVDKAQTITYRGDYWDEDLKEYVTETVDYASGSTPRLEVHGGGSGVINLNGPNTGTIVGDTIIINGGNLTIQPGIDPATGLPLVSNAQNTQVQTGDAQAGDTAHTTTYTTKPLLVDGPESVGNTQVSGTDTSAAGAGAGSNAGAGDVATADTPVSVPGHGDGGGAAPETPDRKLNLQDPILRTPEGAVAVLLGAGQNPRWPDWSQLRIVPGGISANDLQLNLDGRFTNHSQLDVTNQLVIHAAEGIDNFNASIQAGGNVTLTGKYLNNDQGSIGAGALLADIDGTISNNRGRIVVQNDAYLYAGGNIAASEGQFASSAGKLVLDSGGDIDLQASKVSGLQGVGINAAGNVTLGAKQSTQTQQSNQNYTETQAYDNSASGSDIYESGTVVINSRQSSSTTNTTSVGTTVDSAEGSVAIVAGKQLGMTGGAITAGKDVVLAGADVNIQAAKETSTSTNLHTTTVDGRELTRHAATSSSESYSGGTVSAGGKVAIIADGDASQGSGNVQLAGSKIEGTQGIGISATGNVDLQALQANNSTASDGYNTGLFSQSTDSVGSTVSHQASSLSSSEGNVQIGAKGNVDIVGSNITAGQDVVVQGASINVQAVKDSVASNDYEKRGRNEKRLAQTDESISGGEITAGGGITMVANGTPVPRERVASGTPDDPIAKRPTVVNVGPGNITLEGATVTAKGDTALVASGNINLLDMQTEHGRYEETYKKSSGLLSSKRTTTVDTGHASISEGSIVAGDKVYMQAGQDINLRGSHVVGQEAATLVAEGNVNLLAGQDTASATSHKQVKKSGVFGGGGLGITIGSSSTTTDRSNESTRAAASSVQAQGGEKGEGKQGNVTIIAGGHYQQTGSAVLAAGDVNIVAKTTTVDEAREIEKEKFEMRAKQSGLTVSISSPVVGAVQTATNLGTAVGRSSDGRTQALGLAAGGLYAYNNLGKDANGNDTALTSDINNITDGKLPSSIGINVGLGRSESHATSQSEQNTAAGSVVHADGNVNITATQGDIQVRGSDINARQDLSLKAEHGNIALEAAQNTYSSESSHSSSSSSINVGVNVGGGSTGFTVGASHSQGSGQGSGSGTSYSNTSVQAGGTVNLQSSGDTTLRGATVEGETVNANVGGNLHIESLQNQDQYAESSRNSGWSFSIPIYGAGMPGASVSQGRTNIDSNYNSTGTQSGIRAGDGGFNVNVAGDTTLIGGAITSTQTAVEEGKNHFATGGQLTMSDLENEASYQGSGYQATIGMGGSRGESSAGVGKDSGHASSTTTSGISGIAGAQDMRTGDKETGLAPIFDRGQVADNIEAGITVTTAAGREFSTYIGDEAGKKERLFREQAANETDPDRKQQLEAEADKWGEGGVYRVVAHAVAGGLTGGASGAAGAAASQAVIGQADDVLTSLGLSGPAKDTVLTVIGGAVGVATGGAAGGAAAGNATVYNFLTHEQESEFKKELRNCKGDVTCIEDKTFKWMLIDEQQTADVNGCGTGQTCSELGNAARTGRGFSSDEIKAMCGGVPACETFARGLARTNSNDTFTAHDRATSIPVDKAVQRLIDEGFDPTIAAILGMVSPIDFFGGGGKGSKDKQSAKNPSSNNSELSSSGSAAEGNALGFNVPGRVQSRINVAEGVTDTTPLRETGKPVSAGFTHVVEGHFNREPANNRSVFTVTPAELSNILQTKEVVSSPATYSGKGVYERTVDVGYPIGVTSLNEGGVATSSMRVYTDRAGNLITAYPVRSKR